ncbi:unnamed protein product [Adineta steineri]|uniref:RRM domain-containing protein n=1 Tax=Adineta steineri TaxID=433720 RepID=A0A814D658_9BILA|nr:unnamed protein product [Adineta steineri]CAF0949987.1 unnamed protein product [Adineta steineri]
MSTVVIDGLDNRTTSDTVKNFCQNFGKILNCYIKCNQCIVTFAEKHNAEEFIRTSPHRIDSNGVVNATWKVTLNRTFPSNQRPTINSTDNTRLTIRGTFEQLEEPNLVRYFSQYGHVRMCLPNPSQGSATVTFDDRISCERVLKESRHFLNGRSLIIEPYTATTTTTVDDNESNKRMKYSDPNESTLSILTSRFEHEKEQLLNEQIRLQSQFQERIQLFEFEKQQLNEYLLKQQHDFHHQVKHYQYLLQQSLDEITNKDKQIEQLKQENKDIDDLLRQSVHDNEQQQIHLKKREEVHNQTKRKYEELYKAYMKLKDNSTIQGDKDPIGPKTPIANTNLIINKPKSTIDDVRKK